jgi:hypothetical protein
VARPFTGDGRRRPVNLLRPRGTLLLASALSLFAVLRGASAQETNTDPATQEEIVEQMDQALDSVDASAREGQTDVEVSRSVLERILDFFRSAVLAVFDAMGSLWSDEDGTISYEQFQQNFVTGVALDQVAAIAKLYGLYVNSTTDSSTGLVTVSVRLPDGSFADLVFDDSGLVSQTHRTAE